MAFPYLATFNRIPTGSASKAYNVYEERCSTNITKM